MITIRSVYPDGTGSTILNSLGEVSGWKHTHMYPGGPTAASFTFQGSSQINHPALQMGRIIHAYSGSALVWKGRLNSPQKGTPWNLTAVGVAAMAKDHVNGNLTTLNTQVDAAIANGLPWTRPNDLSAFNPTPPLGQTSPLSTTATLDDLLGQCVSQGDYWTVTPQGVLTMAGTPVFAGSYLLYITDWPAQTQGDFATVVYGLYTGGQVTVTATAAQIAKFGRIETTFDTGTNSSGAATTAAQAKLAELLTPAWSQQFTATRGQLLTTGGIPVDLATVRANISTRICALQTGDSYGVTNVDIPMGQVDYDDDSGTLLLTPSTSELDNFSNVLVDGSGSGTPAGVATNTTAMVNQIAAVTPMARGSVTGQTADANGVVAIPHGLGYTPTWASATPNNPRSTNNFNCRVPVALFNSTDIYVQFFLNGSAAASVTNLGCFWQAS